MWDSHSSFVREANIMTKLFKILFVIALTLDLPAGEVKRVRADGESDDRIKSVTVSTLQLKKGFEWQLGSVASATKGKTMASSACD